MKAALDPAGILNPGKVIAPSAAKGAGMAGEVAVIAGTPYDSGLGVDLLRAQGRGGDFVRHGRLAG